MLPRKNRLQKDWLINKVRRQGHRLRSDAFKISVKKRKRGSENRFALVISTKVSKKAVARNRLRRRAWAAIDRILPRMKPAHDIVINFFPQALEYSVADLQAKIEKSFSRGKYLAK